MMKELKAFYMAHAQISDMMDMREETVWGMSPQFINKYLEKHGTSYAEEYDKAMAKLIEKKEKEE